MDFIEVAIKSRTPHPHVDVKDELMESHGRDELNIAEPKENFAIEYLTANK